MPSSTLPVADRIMTRVTWGPNKVSVLFADGRRATLPLDRLRDDDGKQFHTRLTSAHFEDPYTLVLETDDDRKVSLPWDFVRHYTQDRHFAEREQGLARKGREDLGKRLREHREVRGLSQSEAARQSGVARVTLNRVENGEQSPGYETLKRLADLYEASFPSLVTDRPSVESLS